MPKQAWPETSSLADDLDGFFTYLGNPEGAAMDRFLERVRELEADAVVAGVARDPVCARCGEKLRTRQSLAETAGKLAALIEGMELEDAGMQKHVRLGAMRAYANIVADELAGVCWEHRIDYEQQAKQTAEE